MSPNRTVDWRHMLIGFALAVSVGMSSCSRQHDGPNYVFHFKMTDGEIQDLRLNDECKRLIVLTQQESLHRLAVKDVVDALYRYASREERKTTTRYIVPLADGRRGEGDRVFFVDLEKSGETRIKAAGLAVITS